jgi:hypothetical protein
MGLRGGVAVAGSGDLDFDLVAGAIRADAGDAATFLHVLAGKLEAALPGAVRLRHGGGLFARDHPVTEITVELGDWTFRLASERGGLQAERAHRVRGIALQSETMPLDAWVDALLEALREHARSSATAAEALRRLL